MKTEEANCCWTVQLPAWLTYTLSDLVKNHTSSVYMRKRDREREHSEALYLPSGGCMVTLQNRSSAQQKLQKKRHFRDFYSL